MISFFFRSININAMTNCFFLCVGGPSAVKLVDKTTLLKERELKKNQELEKAAEKERKKAELAALTAAKDAAKKVNPKEMFLHETDKYSAFDDKVRIRIFEFLQALK